MVERPPIPAEIKREILIECGHRCAVCGTSIPLEIAHIIPWHRSKEHKAEDLICLCANCHERADKEKWGEKTLREYKQRPWVMRQYEKENIAFDTTDDLLKVSLAKMSTVFISYSQDNQAHNDSVLKFSDRLISEGIDCTLDQYETSPPEGWPNWMEKHIRKSDFVIIVCTETYCRRANGEEIPGKGRGVKWESTLTFNQIYQADSQNTHFIPVLFDPADVKYIPSILQVATYYCVNTEEGYENLYRRLTNQPITKKTKLGILKKLPSKERKSDFIESLESIDTTVLRKKMVKSFSIEDLKLLCADIEQNLKNNGIELKLDLESVEGTTREGKILGLIGYLERRCLLDYLIKAVQEARSGLI